MQISRSPQPHNKIDYYPLPNGYADVFLHRNETTEKDDEGNIIYIAEEVYTQVDQTLTKEKIEENFDYLWNDAETLVVDEATTEERLKALESAMLEIILGRSIQ